MNYDRKRIKGLLRSPAVWCSALALLLHLAPCGMMAGQAEAAETAVQIQTAAGFGASNVKSGNWTPVIFTLRNPGEAVTGDLAVQIAGVNGNKDSAYVQHVELPQGSTKTVTMLLPGLDYAKGNNSIALYRNSIEQDKSVPLEGTAYLQTVMIPRDTVQVGVLAADADTLNFLAVLSQSGKRVNILHLKQSDMPSAALGLDGIDALVMNDFAADLLSEEQVKAIKDWVRRGGSLILAGGAGYSKTAAPFAAMSPVTYQGTTSVKELPHLAKMVKKELDFGESFTLSKAQLTEGAQVIAAEGDLPVWAGKTAGNGRVLYAAYDVSLNPLASWNGNPALWEQILKESFDKAGQYSGNQLKQGPSSFWEQSSALEYFKELKPPKLAALAWVLLLYAITVGPLLYVVLKKTDRREWAWAIIPALALLTSIGVFQFGAANRGAVMAQALHTLELDGQGQGIRKSLLSVFLPKGGSMELQFPGHYGIRAFSDTESGVNSTVSGQSDLVINQGNESASVRLQNIPYSSVSKIRIDEEQPVKAGKLAYKLTSLPGNAAEGEITNQTSMDMTNVAVIVNQYLIQIDKLGAGATVSFSTAGGIGISFAEDVSNTVFPVPPGAAEDNGYQQRVMLNAYLRTQAKAAWGFEPMIIGWAKEQKPIAAGGKSISADQLTLIAQKMDMDYATPEGKIVIPGAALTPEIVDNHMSINAIGFQNGPYMQIGRGDITFLYRIPQIAGAVYAEMEMQADMNNQATLEIWNQQTQGWDAIDVQPKLKWEAEQLAPYISDGSAIRIRASADQPDGTLMIPSISLQGEVQR